ncbi:TerC family protein [Horticoccus luteus]|uniref:TerC family protein n=1 Tax=Horticoccus luteus TaxID=2862869 RepID=A0A8F9TUA0_9BACT|nr:TerC family protein [Horticoccus luteus]QYM79170.1 TerC family protein [Horticoccus luteus]
MTPILGVVAALPAWAWVGFFALIIALLAIDLGVFQRQPHVVKMKEALAWCGVWAALAIAFGAVVWWWRGAEAGQQFLSAYLVELCLSMDNVFVFILIFAYFRVEPRFQHRVLFWGIIGAVVMRAIFILVGVGVIARFHWVLYGFGAFLVYTGIKLALPGSGETEVHPERNRVVRLFRRFFPVAPEAHGKNFFVRHEGRLAATPLFIVLLVVETSDVMFALDSIPAVLAITKSGFIALTSNIFAILGLRSLYFAIHGVMQLFRFLKIGLAAILTFIGVKMLIEHWVVIPTAVSLAVIGGVLGLSMLASVIVPAPAKALPGNAADDVSRDANPH